MRMARRAGQGDFSVRTPFQGDDELGRLGQAFNLLARDLSGLYRELESIVAEKTAHLEHSRRSLELLYKTSRAVSKPVIDESVFATLLSDIEELAETGPGVICLANGFRQGGGTSSLVCRHDWEGDRVCTAGQCDAELAREAASSHRIAIPITDQSRQHGVLLMQLPETGRLEDWQQPLLEAVATNIGIALTRAEQVTEQRRLALLEERGVIARELHDSLAQALSYLKIQVTRLQNAIDNGIDGEALQSIVQELREGVGGAYRELRELLTTFRLRMDEQGLDQALRSAVDEFSRRGSVAIDLDYRISRTIFTPHEEIHLLHVVREALWNVTHHSGAQHCSVMLGQRDDGCVVLVIDDDGGGFDGIGAKGSRYGLTIMKERACSLGGSIRFGTAESGGARIEVAFTPERDKTAHNTMEKTLG
jgi:two-component system nitrate/nitrite sensor histidine kinase NarX